MVVYPPGTLFVGQRFQTKEQVQDAINRFHIVNHCTYKVKHSNTTRLLVECVHNDCAWRCLAILRTREQHWKIMILEGPHTCVSSLISQDHNKLGSQMISQTICEIIKANPSTPISTIIAHIKLTMGYTISYKKGWLAKQHAIENIFGNWEESYNKLPGMLQAMQMYVPGFIWKFNTQPAYQGGLLEEGNVIFKRLFWTFKPCIDGFAFCKPIVQVDETFLYDKYKGTLLVAVAQDGRNNIIPMVMATYTRCNKFFVQRGREVDAMINAGHVYSEIASKTIQDAQSKANTHRVITFERSSTRFLVEETQHPGEVRPAGRFTVRLDEMWCDCGKFQKVHIPCSHVLASCLHAHHNYQIYISPIYTLQQVAKVYEGQFGELRHEDYWPTYTGPTMWPNLKLKSTSKGRPKSSRIRT
uniref:SWIM-type domain-containing protein n=1 Tax=Cajanus cajan TaxID=3821 RepID=A0A151T4Y3_CAJCA|nr:hypothetical protein KK1_016608 [Cajanus cajan]